MVREEQQIFPFLLAALLLLLVIQPQVVGMPRGELVMSVLSSLVQIAAILVIAENRRLRLAAWVLGVPPLLIIWSRHTLTGDAINTAILWGHGLTSVFLAGTAVIILRFILTHELRADGVLGAVCAYVLIGAAAGQLCFIVETLRPNSYRHSTELDVNFAAHDSRSALMMYYSFTTLTTTGYGDIVPNSPLTRTMAWMEAATGQLYLAVLVAGLVSARVGRKLADGPPTSRIRPI
ncbi:MAG: potassium channel family protein [Pirellulales bacterium]